MPKILEQITQILVERFAIQPDKIQLTADFQKDLNMDSMDAIDLLLAVNETFSIRIPEQSLDKIHTVSQLLDCIEKHKPK